MDLIDFLLKTLMQFFTWIIGGIINIILWIFKSIFSGIATAFRKK